MKMAAVDTAANQAPPAVKTAAVNTVDQGLEQKIGPLGEAVAEEFLNAIIEYAAAKLSPSAKAASAAPAAQPAS